ncbi:MAG: cbb3-type cytochrome c oxidase subunit I [Thermoplasmatales archaeon]
MTSSAIREKKSKWPMIVAISTVVVYVIWLAMSAYTVAYLPPVPDKVITTDNQTVFTYKEITQGKYLYQKYGLADYGSILGFGSYFGIDFTSYTLQLDEEYIAGKLGINPFYPNNTSQVEKIAPYLHVSYNSSSSIMTITPMAAEAFNYSINYYSNYFGNNSEQNRLMPHYITNRTVITYITAFFTWSALISLLGYTNGYPPVNGLLHPNTNVFVSSDLMTFAFIIVVLPITAYIFIKLLSYWNDPREPIALPPPTKTQRTTIYAIVVIVLAAAVQGLLGEYVFHLYASPTFYGINLLNILPFNVARAEHYTLAVLWIVATWIVFSLFVLPYFGLTLSKRQVWGIIGGTITVGFLTSLGIIANYLQFIPYTSGFFDVWFMFGGQGRDVVTQGTVWLLLLAIIVSYISYLFFKVSKITLPHFKPLTQLLGISLAGTAFGIIMGALPIFHPWANYTLDEYFRWITIHAFVEGFWPAIIVTIIVTLLIIGGLFPVRLGTAIIGLDATADILSGMIGTGHHYYWGGEPTVWLYVGSIVGILEAIAIGFAVVYAILLWIRRKTDAKTEFQKTLLIFTLVAGIGGGIGAAGFGGGLLNMPILNYYLHDTQVVMAHAHLAFPLAYGLPSIMLWIVILYLTGAMKEVHLKYMRWGAILYGIGFYLQALLSLLPLGILQYEYELKYGFWYIKSLDPLVPGLIPFWQLPLTQTLIWIRMIGDVTAMLGFSIIGFAILFTFRGGLGKSMDSNANHE